jgi:hypothetical protein
VTPAAEEYELSLRLRRRGIPILFAEQLVAGNDTSLVLADICRQQYKHGMGCGEAVRRCPETMEIDELAQIVSRSRGQNMNRGWSTLRGLATNSSVRLLVLELASLAEKVGPQIGAFTPLYRLAISIHFVAGVRDGLERFPSA